MRPLVIAALGAGALCASPAAAKKRKIDIDPYIEVGQVVTADVNSSDVLTYTTVAAGVDASVQSRRVQLQISYRYEHRFSEAGNIGDSNVHSGLARANVAIAHGLSIEAGGLATRAHADIRGAAPAQLTGNVGNTSQVYSFYGGPTLGTHLGPIGVSGSYRIGYTKVNAPTATGVDPTQPRLDVYDHSTNQLAQASLNLKSGVAAPFGITLSGAWERDDASQLSQRYDGRYGRADIIYPILPTFALTAGVGYEHIAITQRDALLDAGGNPVVDARGRFVENLAAPARIAYKFDGLYYDGGVVWKPSSRTQAEAHVGRRYGSISYTGTLAFQPIHNAVVAVNGYDGVTTFGRQLRNGIASLPTSFGNSATAFGNDFNSCTFGTDGAAGGCLNSVFQSISTAAFRARGVDAVASVTHGHTRFGGGVGYSNRKFLAPATGAAFNVNGVTDESYYAELFAAEQVAAHTSVQGTFMLNYYNSGLAGAKGIYSVGGTASLGREFGRFSAVGSIGAYSYAQANR
ncbi:MAG: hypothetical protein ACRCSO_10275, partial [Sphingomonas sp.]